MRLVANDGGAKWKWACLKTHQELCCGWALHQQLMGRNPFLSGWISMFVIFMELMKIFQLFICWNQCYNSIRPLIMFRVCLDLVGLVDVSDFYLTLMVAHLVFKAEMNCLLHTEFVSKAPSRWGNVWEEACHGLIVHYAAWAGSSTAAQWVLGHGASMTRASVLSERCRVLLYQVISLNEKPLKGPSTPFLALWVESGQQYPLFSMVLNILRKSLCIMVAVMADVVEGWTWFFLHVTRPVCVMWAGTGLEDGRGVSLEQSQPQEASWRFQIVLKPSWDTEETRDVSLIKIFSKVPAASHTTHLTLCKINKTRSGLEGILYLTLLCSHNLWISFWFPFILHLKLFCIYLCVESYR